MVIVAYEPKFKKQLQKVKDNLLLERVKKQIAKISYDPEIGKPMRFDRKGTREVYIPPFRLSYKYYAELEKIVFLEFYHKDEQ